MKKFSYVLILLLMTLFLGQGVSLAAPFIFGDNSIHWPKWGNGSGDDIQDEIGIPEFTGGGGTIDSNGYLTELHFDYLEGGVFAGDVFIDVGSDGFWDYVIVTDDDTPDDTSLDPGWTRGVYTVKTGYNFSAEKGVNDNYYLESNVYYPNPPYTNDSFRENHPVTASKYAPLKNIDNSISFTGFTSTPGKVKFADLDGIYVGSDVILTIGFQPTCANDVIYEHVPEPATVLIVGFGLLGLGLCSSKKMKRRG